MRRSAVQYLLPHSSASISRPAALFRQASPENLLHQPLLRRPVSPRAPRPQQHFRQLQSFSRRRSSSSHFPLDLHLRASYSSYVLIVVLVCGSAVLLEYIGHDVFFGASTHNSESKQETSASLTTPTPPNTSNDPFYTDMPIPPGHLGNLTPEQVVKLRELWAHTLKVFGVQDPSAHAHPATLEPPHEETPPVSENEGKDRKKRKSRISLFGKKHDDSASGSGPGSPGKDPSKHISDDDDKYGQVKEFQQILSTQTPESLRASFWSMVKADHPDALLLRFLRARKWDVDKALVMMISTMSWRGTEMHVDDDVVFHGEGGALADSQSTDANVKREGHDFLEQMRIGKSFLHGTDKEGRPLCFVRARLHRGGEQTERSMERYTVYVIETARLALRPPVETACILFDMTHFTMANMDYTPVKFMIKIFEANYPESLGAVLVHKAPWIFQGIWKIIRGWLDPVVASKVHFTSSVEDLQEYIPRSQIIKELGGDEDWEYKYIEPIAGEDDLMKDTEAKNKLLQERHDDVLQYQTKTFDWIAAGSGEGAAKVREERDAVARKLNDNYWRLDPYVRAKTLYDRVGMIENGGKINFYPSHNKQGAKADVANGAAPASAPATSTAPASAPAATSTATPAPASVPIASTTTDDVD